MRRFLLVAAALLTLGLAAPLAQAQVIMAPRIVPGAGVVRGPMRVPGAGGTLNPYNYYDPYGYARQAAFNTALYGRAMSQVPPYALGYNPYPPVINYVPSYNYGYYYSPYRYGVPYYGY